MKRPDDELHYEPDEQDLLGGMPDFVDGRSTKYFSGLSSEDRELVQWYLQTGIEPDDIDPYARGLVEEYDTVVDPERKFSEAIDSAHTELRRLQRYAKLFLSSGDYFPVIVTRYSPVMDICGETGEIEEQGWGIFRPPTLELSGRYSPKTYLQKVRGGYDMGRFS